VPRTRPLVGEKPVCSGYNHLLNPRPILEPIATGVVIVVGRWKPRDCLITRASLHARKPFGEPGSVFPQPSKSEPIYALHVRCDLYVGQTEHIGGKPFCLAELRLDLAKRFIEHLDMIAKEWCLNSFFN
jgi:hypothetical protein